MADKEKLTVVIELLREDLQKLMLNKKNFLDEEILTKSKKLDKLLNKYYQRFLHRLD